MKTQKHSSPSEIHKAGETYSPLVGDDWGQACGRIPVDVEAACQENKVLQRKREVKSGMDLLRIVLAYAVCDWSFRLVGAWASVIGLGELSDVAVRKQLLKTQAWLGQIIGQWLQQRNHQLEERAVRVRLLDATIVSQPGSRGIDWRLHAEFDLAGFKLTGIEVTDVQGGESLGRHEAEVGVINVADRGYAHRTGLGPFLAVQAYVVVRTNGRNLPLETATGEKIDLLKGLKACQSSEPCELLGWVTTPQGRFQVRLIAQALPDEVAEEARRRMRTNSRKKGHTPTELSLVAAGFVLLVTNLPASLWPAKPVLALYRLRWQIELLFKRLKGLLHLDHLRAKNPRLAQVYLLGKLLGALLVEDWTHDAFASELSDWFEDTTRPLCWWRCMSVWADLLRQTIRGHVTLAQWLAAWPRLARYLRDAPRKRKQQAACGRQWLKALGLSLDMFNTLTQHAMVPA